MCVDFLNDSENNHIFNEEKKSDAATNGVQISLQKKTLYIRSHQMKPQCFYNNRTWVH